MADRAKRLTQTCALFTRERLGRNFIAGRKAAVQVGKLLCKYKVDEDSICARERIKVGLTTAAVLRDGREPRFR